MQEQLISLKTAKLAKEKGFNLNSHAFYGCDNPVGNTKPNKLILRSWEPWTKFGSDDSSQEGTTIYSAPIQSLLQKWLREDYGIHITIELQDTTTEYYWSFGITTSYVREFCDEDFTDQAKTVYNHQQYSTYEEALEAGLYEALKLI